MEKIAWLLLEERGIKKAAQELSGQDDLTSHGLANCLGCASELGFRTALRVLGPNTIISIPPGCMAASGGTDLGRRKFAKSPVLMTLLGNSAAMLSGVKRHYQMAGCDVHVVAYSGDGATVDAGLQCLSAAAERGENIIYICNDNEAYMNTGNNRCSSTPFGAHTTTSPAGARSVGKSVDSKEMALLMAMQGIPYVAAASVAYMPDFVSKLRKAMGVRHGLSYIHLHAPCPVGWGFPPEKTIEVARKAVLTNYFPLWEMEGGRLRFTLKPMIRRPIKDYLSLCDKFGHLKEREIKKIQKTVDARHKKLKKLSNVKL